MKGHRGTKAATALLRSSHPRPATICSSCHAHRTSRPYSASAALAPSPTPSPPSPPPPQTTQTQPVYTPQAGILLSRPPLLTKPPSAFESAFFFYQKRLNERLVMPFTRYFYFKPATPADADYKLKAKERNGQAARELGGYNAYGREGWNDELLVGEEKGGGIGVDVGDVRELLVRESVVRAVEGKDGKVMVVSTENENEGEEYGDAEVGKMEAALVKKKGREGELVGLESCKTEADKTRDMRRLDRKLGRTLYLVVKRKEGGWGFPAGGLEGGENLSQAAQRILASTAGQNMNTWFVGHAPIGHYISLPRFAPSSSPSVSDGTTSSTPSTTSPSSSASEPQTLIKPGTKTFFMKSRIMAGQADLKDNQYGMEDFKWLTKQEVEKHVGLKYYSWVKGMLADR